MRSGIRAGGLRGGKTVLSYSSLGFLSLSFSSLHHGLDPCCDPNLTVSMAMFCETGYEGRGTSMNGIAGACAVVDGEDAVVRWTQKRGYVYRTVHKQMSFCLPKAPALGLGGLLCSE